MASKTRIHYDHLAKVLQVRDRMLQGGVDIHVNYVTKNIPENLRVTKGEIPDDEEIERMKVVMLHSRHLFEAIVINGDRNIPCEERVKEYLILMGTSGVRKINKKPVVETV